MIFKGFWFHYTKYGPNPSTHDFLKCVAVLLMICDHIGLYFCPDQEMWRAIGRICVPIWFFLPGYARPGRMGTEILFWGALMVVASITLSETVMPVNALLAVAICRIYVNYLARTEYNGHNVIFHMAMLLIWLPITTHLFAYGSLALMFSLAGYLCKHYAGSMAAKTGLAIAWLAFVVVQQVYFNFDTPAIVVMTIGTAAVCLYLAVHRTVFIDASNWRMLAAPINFIGRNSLYIYALHFMAFQYIYRQMHPLPEWQFKLFAFM